MIHSSVEYYYRHSRLESKPHIISTNIEHDSIRGPLEYFSNTHDDKKLMHKNQIDVTFVSVSKETGCVDVDDILSAIRPETCLITVMMANNETGVIQPIRELGIKMVKVNEERVKQNLPTILLHSDAAQAIGKIPVDVQDLRVDFLTIVGHKVWVTLSFLLYLNISFIQLNCVLI